MSTAVRRVTVVVLLMLYVGCGRSAPTSPTEIQPPAVSSTAIPPARMSFPPLSGPSRTFTFDREMAYAVRDFTRLSRVVLYDNGAFGLQYPSIAHVYRGAYRNANGVLMFLFDWSAGRSVDEPWVDATGILQGNSLTLQFDDIMQHSDFENAVYVLMPRPSDGEPES
jgi:hypothetical protein